MKLESDPAQRCVCDVRRRGGVVGGGRGGRVGRRGVVEAAASELKREQKFLMHREAFSAYELCSSEKSGFKHYVQRIYIKEKR